MADGRHFEKKVKCDISAGVHPILMKFGLMMHLSPLYTYGKQKITKFQNPRWRTAAILKIKKSQYLQNRLADVAEILYGDTY